MITIKGPAFAKLNLYLDIVGRREDGYHLIETVMHSISLHDEVNITLTGGGISLETSRSDIPADERNTAYKAAALFFEETKIPAGAELYIKKNIPVGAGLAGGSADAAAVLNMLNKAFDFPLEREKILRIAEKIGADVPFCVVGGTRLCKGIGEKISDISCNLSGLYNKAFLVAKPPFSCMTGEAYRSYDENPTERYGGLERFCASLSGDFAGNMYNVFQRLYSDPRIDGLCGRLVSLGAQGAMLTGSGSAVFGVFSDRKKAEKAAEDFGDKAEIYLCESADNCVQGG